jgi:hypothetical protein
MPRPGNAREFRVKPRVAVGIRGYGARMMTCPDAGALAKRSEDEVVERHALGCRRCMRLVALMEARTGTWHQVDGHWVPASGSLAGRVTRSGVPVPGVEVSVADGEIEYLTTTGGDGSYQVESVMPGSYRIQARPGTDEHARSVTVVTVELRIREGANVADLEIQAPAG